VTEPVVHGRGGAERGWPAELDAEYELVSELGRGAMAVVYRARDRELGREVAIKVVRARFAADEEAVARLAREARTVAQLEHPNIVGLYSVRRLPDQSLALVMQMVPGRTLKRALQEDGPFTAERAEDVLRDIARALAYAHRCGIVHRDVKPENIFLDEVTGRALLSDFGVARSLEGSTELTATGTVIGTPTYMAPEQIDGGRLDGRSDLYSLGMVGWEMLTGRRPWAGETLYSVIYRQKHELLPPVDEYRDDVAARLQYLIEGLLHKNPDRRWSSAARLLSLMALDAPLPGFREWDAARRRRRRSRPTSDPRERGESRTTPALETMKFRRGSGAADIVPADLSGMTDDDIMTPSERPSAAVSGHEIITPPPSRRIRRWEIAAVVALVLFLGGTFYWQRLRQQTEATAATVLGADRPAGVEVPMVAPPASGAGVTDSIEALAAQNEARVLDSLSQLGDSLSAAEAKALIAGAPPPTAPPTTTVRSSAAEIATQSRTDTAAGGRGAAPPRSPLALERVPNAVDRGTVATSRTDTVTRPPVTTPPPAPAPTPTAAPASASIATEVGRLAAGSRHTCAIDPAAGLRCWGASDRGQSGDARDARAAAGAGIAGLAPSGVVQVTSGSVHSCALTRGGEAYCWGDNDRGQLGDGTNGARGNAVRAAPLWSFRLLRAGNGHTCGITRGGDLVCWGANESGQLGTGGVGAWAAPSLVPIGERVGAVALGAAHSCAITATGTLMCWGRNSAGQVGDGTAGERRAPVRIVLGADSSIAVSTVAAGSAHTCAAAATGSLYCWGRGNSGQLGLGGAGDRALPTRVTGLNDVEAVVAGSVHTCARQVNGAAWCWGSNVYGQLGSSGGDRNAPVRVSDLPPIALLTTGGAHTCAATSTGEWYCWGNNADGQLGDGTRENRSKPQRLSAAPRS
jgi:serine/threonine protein kinase/alpha-tubulin suppressor-like RCC1 family protein